MFRRSRAALGQLTRNASYICFLPFTRCCATWPVAGDYAAGPRVRRAGRNKRSTQRKCNQYTRAEESVMRCSQACVVAVALYLRKARRRSTLRRCPSTCSCPRARPRRASRSRRRASRPHPPGTAAAPPPSLSPCRATAACRPVPTQIQCKNPPLSFFCLLFSSLVTVNHERGTCAYFVYSLKRGMMSG